MGPRGTGNVRGTCGDMRGRAGTCGDLRGRAGEWPQGPEGPQKFYFDKQKVCFYGGSNARQGHFCI